MARRVVFVGDGSNDIHAAAVLLPGDLVLARAHHPLGRWVQQQQQQQGGKELRAEAYLWATYEELLALVERLVC